MIISNLALSAIYHFKAYICYKATEITAPAMNIIISYIHTLNQWIIERAVGICLELFYFSFSCEILRMLYVTKQKLVFCRSN